MGEISFFFWWTVPLKLHKTGDQTLMSNVGHSGVNPDWSVHFSLCVQSQQFWGKQSHSRTVSYYRLLPADYYGTKTEERDKSAGATSLWLWELKHPARKQEGKQPALLDVKSWPVCQKNKNNLSCESVQTVCSRQTWSTPPVLHRRHVTPLLFLGRVHPECQVRRRLWRRTPRC